MQPGALRDLVGKLAPERRVPSPPGPADPCGWHRHVALSGSGPSTWHAGAAVASGAGAAGLGAGLIPDQGAAASPGHDRLRRGGTVRGVWIRWVLAGCTPPAHR